jgi:substrate import-associated zinc metallohydrolase lipoprotein
MKFKIIIMKKIIIYLLSVLLTGVLWSCKEDGLSDESIFTDSQETQTAFDEWLLKNYTFPYNISFQYKWTDIESDMGFDFVPATVEKSLIVAKILKHTWIDVYQEAAGTDFVRSNIPRVIQLAGTAKYTSSTSTRATVTNATTTAGMKILIYRVNETNPATLTIGWLTNNWLKTIYHEFSHALHQKKNYSEDFAKLTNADYNGGDWNLTSQTLDAAYQLGFVSRYARENTDEDFVETMSIYITRSRNWVGATDDDWNTILEKAGPVGADLINQKLEFVRSYLKAEWGITLDELRRVFERHAETLSQVDLTTL